MRSSQETGEILLVYRAFSENLDRGYQKFLIFLFENSRAVQ